MVASASAQFAYPYGAGFYHYAPAVAKYEVKTAVAEADESLKTPASTTKFDTKVVTKEFTAPVAAPVFAHAPVVAAAPASVVATTYAAPYAAQYAYPYAGFPYTYPVLATATEAEKKVESSRKKRSVVIVPKPSQFYNDLLYKSVDLNQDGQPDKAAVVTSYAYPYAYPYASYAHPYSYGLPFYG